MMRLLMLTLLLLPLCLRADAIYRTVDAAGNIVFTDAPNADGGAAEAVDIERTNTVEPPSASSYPAAQRNQKTETTAAPYAVAIVKPANETSFPMGPGNFSVSAQVSPKLGKYESLQLILDGAPHGAPQPSTYWDLNNVFRGAHDLVVQVIDAQGKTIAASEPVRVYVHRPSTNFKNRK